MGERLDSRRLHCVQRYSLQVRLAMLVGMLVLMKDYFFFVILLGPRLVTNKPGLRPSLMRRSYHMLRQGTI